jgi:integrase
MYDMAYQYKREPLTQDEATRLANACQDHEERLVVWTLLDTDLRVAELAGLTRGHLDWQGHRLTIYGKGGPYGSKTKRRIVPLTPRLQPMIEGHFSLHEAFGIAPRTIQQVGHAANRVPRHLRAGSGGRRYHDPVGSVAVSPHFVQRRRSGVVDAAMPGRRVADEGRPFGFA